ncbi:tRNA (guanosine(37)-N1)-methyltransferase TrmD [Jonesia quinghaiensis]|uniref:tRNA (guanosine(37)-N1)-methyltransferase TrmD n=1 Tax=Jonesia quinghaiensis TaxID=262806 RepID=UPI000404086E|nr:tRNA (guanosine(37)-N1)-methyltransferase TrmD [Jonesia quinghaiensis]
MNIDVVTIFPDYLAPLNLSLVGKARQEGVVDIAVHDLREWTTDRHRTVDDTPIGGGAGMVMKPDVWALALDDLVDPATPQENRDTVIVIPTPSGRTFTQALAHELALASHLVFACGRYEGIDARVAEHYRGQGVRVEELSIGDYVLNGGEVASMVMIEAIARLVPGVVGNPESLVEESHGAAGLLEYPVYTRPPQWRDTSVPEILLSGHHAKIARWRRDQALQKTAVKRPDMIALLDVSALDRHDRMVLEEHGWTVTSDGKLVYSPAAVTE